MKAAHLSASLSLYTNSEDKLTVCGGHRLGTSYGFKALKKLKGSGLWTAGARGLHSLTWWGFWSELPPHGSLSDGVFFSSVCLKSAGRKVTPSWSQQVRRSNGGWPGAIANVQTFVSFFTPKKLNNKKNGNKGECKAIDLVPGHLQMFWWCTPRIPGISRVFQSYMVWDSGTPRSQEKLISRTPLPGTRREREREKNQHQNFVLDRAKNDDSTHDFCISSLKSEQIIDAIQEKQTRAVWLPSRPPN